MTTFDLFTIGHSNIPAERFIALLRDAGVETIADVRSVPVSRFCPWFSAKNLAPLLAGANMSYLFFGDELGGRPRDPSLYCDGVADYEAMARRPSFQDGLDRLLVDAGRRCLCLMCSERAPLDCHRCLLVARALAAPVWRSGISCMTAESNRTPLPSAGFSKVRARTAISSQLDRTRDSRQRIAAGRAPSRIALTETRGRRPSTGTFATRRFA
jgi:Protein of unknown function, DUF488